MPAGSRAVRRAPPANPSRRESPAPGRPPGARALPAPDRAMQTLPRRSRASAPRRGSPFLSLICRARRPPWSAPAISVDALLGQPQIRGRRAGLVENIDRHAAAREPIAADAQPFGADRLDQPARDGQRAILVEDALV